MPSDTQPPHHTAQHCLFPTQPLGSMQTRSSSLPEGEDAATTGQGTNPNIFASSIFCPDLSLEDAKTLHINSYAT